MAILAFGCGVSSLAIQNYVRIFLANVGSIKQYTKRSSVLPLRLVYYLMEWTLKMNQFLRKFHTV